MANYSSQSNTEHMLAGMNLRGLLRIFYIMDPRETMFPTVDDVPNYLDQVWTFLNFCKFVRYRSKVSGLATLLVVSLTLFHARTYFMSYARIA